MPPAPTVMVWPPLEPRNACEPVPLGAPVMSMPVALTVCVPPDETCANVPEAAMLSGPLAVMFIGPLVVETTLSTTLIADELVEGEPAVPTSVIVPWSVCTDAPAVVLNGCTEIPCAAPPATVVPPTPVMDSAPLPTVCTAPESDTPAPIALPAPRLVPPAPINVMAPAVCTRLEAPPTVTPLTEFVPVAFDVPPMPVMEIAPPLDESTTLAARTATPRASPVAEVPAVPFTVMEPVFVWTKPPVLVLKFEIDTPFALPAPAALPPKPARMMLPNPFWNPPRSGTSMPLVSITAPSAMPMPVALLPPVAVPPWPVIEMFFGVVPGFSVAVRTTLFWIDTPTDEPAPEATLPPVPSSTMPPSDSTIDCWPLGAKSAMPLTPTLLPVPPVPVMVKRPLEEISLPTTSMLLPRITPTALPPELPPPVPPVPVIVSAVPLPPTCEPLPISTPAAPPPTELPPTPVMLTWPSPSMSTLPKLTPCAEPVFVDVPPCPPMLSVLPAKMLRWVGGLTNTPATLLALLDAPPVPSTLILPLVELMPEPMNTPPPAPRVTPASVMLPLAAERPDVPFTAAAKPPFGLSAVTLMLPAPVVLMGALRLITPAVLFRITLPPDAGVMAPTLSGAALVKLMFPLPELLAANCETVFALLRLMPPVAVALSTPVELIKPEAVSV